MVRLVFGPKAISFSRIALVCGCPLFAAALSVAIRNRQVVGSTPTLGSTCAHIINKYLILRFSLLPPRSINGFDALHSFFHGTHSCAWMLGSRERSILDGVRRGAKGVPPI